MKGPNSYFAVALAQGGRLPASPLRYMSIYHRIKLLLYIQYCCNIHIQENGCSRGNMTHATDLFTFFSHRSEKCGKKILPCQHTTMARAYCAVLVLLLVSQAVAFLGPASSFVTGTVSAGLRAQGATASSVDRQPSTCRRAKSGAASTVMMPIGVPKVGAAWSTFIDSLTLSSESL